MILTQVIMFLLLHLLPYSLLKMWLCKKLSRGIYQFVPQFSGRVALFLVAEKLYKKNGAQIALLPDYACNIIHRAFSLAGWHIITYKTDEFFEADWDEVNAIINNQKVAVLVGASVFGSSGLIEFLNDKHKTNQLRSRSTQVVLDIAQDIRLVEKIPFDCSDFVTVVVSFNDKSFLGGMGGGILSSTLKFPTQKKLHFRQSLLLYMFFLRKLFNNILRLLNTSFDRLHYIPNNMDYSYCQRFPYRIEPFQPTKLQLILAIVGIYFLPYYQMRKKKLIQLGVHLPTRFADSAAYLVLKNSSIFEQNKIILNRTRKPPYAKENNPNVSIRAEDFIVHNKGFFDLG